MQLWKDKILQYLKGRIYSQKKKLLLHTNSGSRGSSESQPHTKALLQRYYAWEHVYVHKTVHGEKLPHGAFSLQLIIPSGFFKGTGRVFKIGDEGNEAQ